MSLAEYRRKRDFTVTSEPSVKGGGRAGQARRFVVQRHAATNLHFDFRLELNRTLVSWAVPKGLPLVHGEKRLAVKVEDHPLSYFDFEGTIPKGQYGGGTVQVWDVGTYEPLTAEPLKGLRGGKLHFQLQGKKLTGEWYLVRLREANQWLIIRGGADHPAVPRKALETSALTGRTLKQIANAALPLPPSTTAGTPSRRSSPSRATTVHHARKSLNQLNKRDEPTTLAPGDIDFIEPMKARIVKTPPSGEWVYELKFDGFRALAYKKGKAVALISRTHRPLTSKFPNIAEAVQALDSEEAVFDGEIVALDPQGRSSFQLLQAYEMGEEIPAIYYYVFDLLELNGKSLRRRPLEERRALLQALVPRSGEVIRFSSSFEGAVQKLLVMIRQHGLEGLIGKRAGSAYEAGRRSGAWIKLKVTHEQEFVIGGYTKPSGTRAHLGALLVGYYEAGALRYAGKVGTGFSSTLLAHLRGRFDNLAQPSCPFTDLPETSGGRHRQGVTASVMKQCHWLKPVLVAQVRFAEWTRDGRLRQPVFLALREDKPAKQVIRESPA